MVGKRIEKPKRGGGGWGGEEGESKKRGRWGKGGGSGRTGDEGVTAQIKKIPIKYIGC